VKNVHFILSYHFASIIRGLDQIKTITIKFSTFIKEGLIFKRKKKAIKDLENANYINLNIICIFLNRYIISFESTY